MTPESAPAVHLTRLTKRFGDHVAVNGIDLTVPAGVFYGIVGPNGAGKSTTLAMIAGLLTPTPGSVRVGGATCAGDDTPPNAAQPAA